MVSLRVKATLPGIVYLVGAGPGAPDLLTLRAARLLATADIVLHDALIHPDTLLLARQARLVDVGKRANGAATDQRFIDRALIAAAARYQIVVRLKGGDPSLFARAAEELDALAAAGVCCEMVPGVTAALAAAAEFKMPLTRRGVARSVAFATLRQRRGARSAAPTLPRADTLMLYMARGDIETTQQALLAAGYAADTPVVCAANVAIPGATLQRATIATLTALAETDPVAPVLLGVGATFGDDFRSGEARAPQATPMRACAR